MIAEESRDVRGFLCPRRGTSSCPFRMKRESRLVSLRGLASQPRRLGSAHLQEKGTCRGMLSGTDEEQLNLMMGWYIFAQLILVILVSMHGAMGRWHDSPIGGGFWEVSQGLSGCSKAKRSPPVDISSSCAARH